MPRAAVPGSGLPLASPPPAAALTLACAHRPDGRRDPNCRLSRWEGRETRGIPLVVWENELHLPLTCGGSTFPTPSGGHSSPGVAARTWEPSGPSSREVELGGQWTPPVTGGKCFTMSRVPRVSAPGSAAPASSCPARAARAGPPRVKRGPSGAAADPATGSRAQRAGRHLPRGAAERCGAGMRKRGGEGRARARCARGWRRRAERAWRGRAGCSRRRCQQVRPAPAAAPAALVPGSQPRALAKFVRAVPELRWDGTAGSGHPAAGRGRRRRVPLCAPLRARVPVPSRAHLYAPLRVPPPRPAERCRPAPPSPSTAPPRTALGSSSVLRSGEPGEGRAVCAGRGGCGPVARRPEECTSPKFAERGRRARAPAAANLGGRRWPGACPRGAARRGPGARPVGGAVRSGQAGGQLARKPGRSRRGVGRVAEKWGTMRVSNFRKSL